MIQESAQVNNSTGGTFNASAKTKTLSKLGACLPFSMRLMVLRSNPLASASCSWVHSRPCRNAATRCPKRARFSARRG